MIGIECKSSTGVQSAEQILFQRQLIDAGGLYILARNVDTVEKAIGGML